MRASSAIMSGSLAVLSVFVGIWEFLVYGIEHPIVLVVAGISFLAGVFLFLASSERD